MTSTTTIPNQLNITIKTSIPGYQRIEYKPFMTNPKISKNDRSVLFNPLFKLNKNIVDKVPENLRKQQFFNKGLFESLLNFTNGIKANTLSQATRNGYVDNNIRVTLDTIFPENSVIYINNKPYTIADFQWSRGDWKIDAKIKQLELDSSRITEPMLYQTVIKDEIISGEKQLQTLPSDLVYGINYNGPKNDYKSPVAAGIQAPIKTTPYTPIVKSPETQVPLKTTETQVIKPTIPPSPGPAPIKNTTPENNNNNNNNKVLPPSPPLQIKDINEIKNVANPKTIEKYPDVVEPTNPMKMSISSTNFLRNFYNETNFYNLINNVYIESNSETKNIIRQSLSETTRVNIKTESKNVSRASYKESVYDIKLIQNSGKGNCFFIAVADALNYHNYYNQKDRIINGRYGTGVNLYTQMYLRSLVLDYITTWSELDSYLENIAPITAEHLNNIFIAQLNSIKESNKKLGNDEITPENYKMIANSVFNSIDNFLVKNIDSVPIIIEDYEKPFKVLEKNQIKNYILNSDFWANEMVIYALCSKLKLNIIPIERLKFSNGKEIVRIPFANFYKDVNMWTKYLFLYFYQSHFELITFNYNIFVPRLASGKIVGKKILKKTKIIFNRNDKISELPPIYILFTIFGSYFTNITDEEEKQKFTFKKEIMFGVQDIIDNKIYNNSNYNTFFYPTFKLYFPYSKIKKPVEGSTDLKAIENGAIEGGAVPLYNRNPIYNSTNPYLAKNMLKRENDYDGSQIAYYITIDMELKPGTSLLPTELKNAKCNSKWNAVRKSYSELVGKPYVITPVYENDTKKYRPKGGKRNKTKKML